MYVDGLLVGPVASAVGEVQVHRGTPAFGQNAEVHAVPGAGGRQLPVDSQRHHRPGPIALNGAVIATDEGRYIGLG